MKMLMTTILAAIIALTFGTSVFAAVTRAPEKAVAKTQLVDINTASEDQLKAILGIGDEYAKKLVAGRPYASKDHLKDKNIIPADVYEKIQKLIDSLC